MNTRTKAERDAEIEHQSLQAVFCAEIDTTPVTYTYQSKYDGEKVDTFRHSYDGAPDFLPEFTKDYDNTYFTAVRDCLWGLPPEQITINGRTYDRIADYVSSGETECVWRGNPGDGVVTVAQADADRCPYCDANVGEEHGYIYLGDGWAEVVYRARLQFPTVAEVAAELTAINAEHVDVDPDNEDNNGIDVRLQVYPDGDWYVRSGLSDYGQDHRGFWGASNVPGNGTECNVTETANALLGQAQDDYAQSLPSDTRR